MRDVAGFWQNIQYTKVSAGMEAHRQLFGVCVRELISDAQPPQQGQGFWGK